MAKPVVTLAKEQELFASGYTKVAGMDEVGRGCLAGPVMVGVTVVEPGVLYDFDGLRDSKDLTQKARERLFPEIKRTMHCAVGLATAAEIDQLGITTALKYAGMRALEELQVGPDVVLLDGHHNWLGTHDTFDVVTHIKADSQCTSVAAASVIAKVTRDALMTRYAQEHPDYLWEKNKGYGTAAHREAIREHGVTDFHRKTWRLI